MADNYIYADLSVKGAVVLTIDRVDYEITQYSSSWACNEIPSAICMLAIGRNAATGQPATVHRKNKPKQMAIAEVWFHPRGDYDVKRKWPADRQLIFLGRFTGFSFRKIAGKIHAIANLVHWSIALDWSSSLTKQGHVSNPTQLNSAAVLQSLNDQGAAEGFYLSQLPAAQLVAASIDADLWKGIKSVFCGIASVPALRPGPGLCDSGGTGTLTNNDVALSALNRMEGLTVTGACDVPRRWSVPLKLDDVAGIPEIGQSIAIAVGGELIDSYSGTSFWDKLVGQFCPAYGLAVVPMVESMIVIADTPALGGNSVLGDKAYWREIKTTEQDAMDMSSELHRPVRGIGVLTGFESATGGGNEHPEDKDENFVGPQPAQAPQPYIAVGGCYVEDSVAANDGAIIYVASPRWLSSLRSLSMYTGDTLNFDVNGASGSTTTPFVGPSPSTYRTPGQLGELANHLYSRYAKDVYVKRMLRGHDGSVSGKLRFDIAPGSIVKLKADSELFIGGEDDLAETLFACVSRVTISINAEAGLAGTTFGLSHTRTATENKLPRTSVKSHPLFGNAIHGGGRHGCPLVNAYEFPE